MDIKIYQINRTRDVDRIKFLGMDSLPAFQGNRDINSRIYDMVYQGSVEAWKREIWKMSTACSTKIARRISKDTPFPYRT